MGCIVLGTKFLSADSPIERPLVKSTLCMLNLVGYPNPDFCRLGVSWVLEWVLGRRRGGFDLTM